VANDYDIVYQCDSRPEIGNGHLKRGLDILHALLRMDSGLNLALCGRYADSARRFMDTLLDDRITVIEAEAAEPRSDVVVMDTMHRDGDPSYFNPDETKRIAGLGNHFVIISSGLRVDLPVACDLFIDHLPDVDIKGIHPRDVRAGFEYAPVASEFFTHADDSDIARPGWLVAVLGGGPVQIGPSAVAETFYDQVDQHFPGFVMVVSPHFPADQIAGLRERFPKLELMQGVPTLAPLLQHAGAVICTYGNITYEALSCGKPVFLASYLDFQDEYGAYLEQKGLVVNLGRFDQLDTNKAKHLFDEQRRSKLANQARGNFRRSGIDEIADMLIEIVEDD